MTHKKLTQKLIETAAAMTSLASELEQSDREELEAEAARHIDLVMGAVKEMVALKWDPAMIEQMDMVQAALKLGVSRSQLGLP